jgi:hypothetical protein
MSSRENVCDARTLGGVFGAVSLLDSGLGYQPLRFKEIDIILGPNRVQLAMEIAIRPYGSLLPRGPM